jgi:hypothetical protein
MSTAHVHQHARKLLIEATPSPDLERKVKEEIEQITSTAQDSEDLTRRIFDFMCRFPAMLLEQEQSSLSRGDQDLGVEGRR